MSRSIRKIGTISFFIISMLAVLILTPIMAKAAEVDVYRIYNRKSAEHLYTTSQEEVNALCQGDWTNEGTGWKAPDSGEPVYRLYNPQLADHLYTTDENEVTTLTTQRGWTKDFDGQPLFYSGGGIPVYRLYNGTNARHHLTVDGNEYGQLPGAGWTQEGPKLYASAVGSPAPAPAPTPTPSNATLTIKLNLPHGDPNDELIGIYNRVWRLGLNGDKNRLNPGQILKEVNSDGNGIIQIPNDLAAGHYVLSREYDGYYEAVTEFGDFDIAPSEVGQTITKEVNIDYMN